MKIIVGIASTTHIDRHNERMAKSALDGMARQIKERFIPQLVNHDPNQHIGVILYGEVFQLKDGEYALGVVAGIFENNKEKITFKTGQPNNVWENYKKYLCKEDLMNSGGENRNNKNQTLQLSSLELSIADLLEMHFNSTQVLPNGIVYKIKRFIVSTGDWRIIVYPKDHDNPPQPHFHVISKQRKIDARFDINTLELISTKNGKIQQKDIKKIQNFFEMHPDILEKLKNEHTRLL